MIRNLLFGEPPQSGATYDGVFSVQAQLSKYLFEAEDCSGRGKVLIFDAALPLKQITIYGALVMDTDPQVQLRLTSDSWWVESARDPDFFSDEVVELAAGFGGMTLGCSFLGAKSRLALDFNPLACSHLRGLGLGPVFEMDLTNAATSKRVHMHLGSSHPTFLFGFPCQPFSSQGLGLGLSDHRCQVFWAGLSLFYLNQGQALVLECVQEAGSNKVIQEGVNILAAVMDMDFLQIHLDLADQWVSRRARWWGLLLPKAWVGSGLKPWPKSSSFQVIGDIIQHWGVWSEHEELQLQLTQAELYKYGNPIYGSEPRLLSFSMKANTLLHSYGNALGSCPCHCRSSPFAEASLQSKGLRGFFATSRVSGAPRYLHHREAALLLGVPDQVSFSGDCKENLCLLGLIASPMQALWIYSHLLTNFAHSKEKLFSIDPEQVLASYKHEILRQSDHLFWTEDIASPGIIRLAATDGSELHLVSPTATTAARLISAEKFSLEWGDSRQLFDPQGRLIADDVKLGTGPYRMTSTSKRQRRERPLEFIMVSISHQGVIWTDCIPAGSFIFQALREHELYNVHLLVDDFGIIYGADHRLWSSAKLSTVVEDSFPTLKIPSAGTTRFPISGAGPMDFSFMGLNDRTIWLSLQSITKDLPSHEIPLIVHPILAKDILMDDWRDLQKENYHLQLGSSSILCIFASENHWAVLHGHICGKLVNWNYLDGIPDKLLSAAKLLAKRIACLCRLQVVGFHSLSVVKQNHFHTCGTIALAHAALQIGFIGDFDSDAIQQIHHWLLIHQKNCIGSITALGFSPPDLFNQLAMLLKTKGVPSNAAQERSNAIIAKLGQREVQQAMNAKNPWHSLKAIASRPQSMIRLVLPEELSQQIDERSKSKFGANIQNAKGKKVKHNCKSNNQTAIHLDPAQLLLDPKHFKDSDGDAVAQIDFQEVEVEATGIALCDFSQAEHFLASDRKISSGALALLILQEPPRDVQQKYELTPITFPAKYKGTEEHIILFGAIKQLGILKVDRSASSSKSNHTIVENQVLKIQAFRDELEFPWLDFIQAPVRHLLNLLPVLQLCQGTNCGSNCGKTHAAVDEPLDTIVMEVWSRSFFLLEKGRAPAQEAELFSVYLRVPKSMIRTILEVQCKGIYFEPRSTTTNAHDETYRVIWLPQKDRQGADHACRSCAETKGLVRLRMKYGVRVLASDEASVFSQLRPDTPYVAASVQRIFALFPLPHGTQRSTIIAFLKEINWKAKPLQPGKAQAGAMSWHVGTSDDPPAAVLNGFGKDILATEIKIKQHQKETQNFIASNRTQSHMRGFKPTPMVDPWQADASLDPWHRAKWNPNPPATGGKSHLEGVTDKLKAELQDSIRKELEQLSTSSQDVTMTEGVAITQMQEQTDARFKRLEVSVAKVQAQNQQFQGWFHQIGTKQSSMEQAISQVQGTLTTHHQEFQKISSEVTNMNTSIRNEVRQAMTDHQADFDNRFDRLESLLAKKMKPTE